MLTDTPLRSFPESIGNLQMLSELEADFSSLDSLPESFATLNLWTLSTGVNDLRCQFPASSPMLKLGDVSTTQRSLSKFSVTWTIRCLMLGCVFHDTESAEERVVDISQELRGRRHLMEVRASSKSAFHLNMSSDISSLCPRHETVRLDIDEANSNSSQNFVELNVEEFGCVGHVGEIDLSRCILSSAVSAQMAQKIDFPKLQQLAITRSAQADLSLLLKMNAPSLQSLRLNANP